mmetsp:Transcript_26612/g.103548  ORF Transcript_26612/g.103548 Transcript_26612/m.103548 type:complete len:90 (-) Transcript_26612:1075-1344(-)
MHKHKSLEVSKLTVKYSNKTILQNINFTIHTGKIIGVVGPNGAGKSTLLKAILGLLAKTSAQIKYNGQDIHTQKHKLAYIPQRSLIDWD